MINFILGLFVFVKGLSLIYFSRYLVELFGVLSWAEKTFRGTQNFYLLVGMFLIGVGVLLMVGLLEFASVTDTQSMNYLDR
ncbi:MAG: hypothetical protein NZL83_02770 [Candidatus Absconditabacterales bacterium]|nr:hypothetical protein [Candidatus Absconditabacterales bacterium]